MERGRVCFGFWISGLGDIDAWDTVGEMGRTAAATADLTAAAVARAAGGASSATGAGEAATAGRGECAS